MVFLFILPPILSFSQISGFVSDYSSDEKLEGVLVRNIQQKTAALSNSYGFFSISAQEGDSLEFSLFTYEKQLLIVSASQQNQRINIRLKAANNELEEVIISEKSILNEEIPGKVKITNSFIKDLPLLLGEKDVLKAFQLLPGIQEISEGSTSLSVRGGGKDQNLILLDESTVYNTNHLFGFFSTFNADPIQQAEIYKGAFPAQYGGRLSSVIDIKMKEGNKEKYELEGGLGLISSRLMIQGPIRKHQSSFIVSGRRTYLDWILTPFLSDREKISYYFGDLNAKVNFKIKDKSHFYLSYYYGQDDFSIKSTIPRSNGFLEDRMLLNWKNTTLTSRLNTVLSKRLFQNISMIYSNYNMGFESGTDQNYLHPPRNSKGTLDSDIKDLTFKLDYDYFVKPGLSLKIGTAQTLHQFAPRDLTFSSNSDESFNFSNETPHSQHTEGAFYINLIGQKNKVFYEAGLRNSYSLTVRAFNPEPRLTVGYKAEKYTLTTAYSRMNQYIHMVSNSGQGLPTDIWIPSSEKLKPASSDILSAGISGKIKEQFKISLEAYYKWIIRSIEYRSDVSFIGLGLGNNLHSSKFLWEDVLEQGKSWNYGYELTLEKPLGRFTAIGGYTLSWSISKFDHLNKGKPFYNKQDRRHIFEITGKYTLTPRLSLSANFNFSTGNMLTVPDGVSFTGNNSFYQEYYNGYNGFRTENYHRMDVGLNYKTKRGNWDFSIYNVYNRKNPYSYDLKGQTNPGNGSFKVNLNRQWLLPILPSLTYNIKI